MAVQPKQPAPDPWAKTSVQVILATLGNTQLKPEKSINTQLGAVYQPSWFPGFSASLDYYRVAVSGEISTIDRATSVNNCFAGLTQYCSAIITTPGTTYSSIPPRWLQVNSQYFNVASVVTDGFNFETSYQFNLQEWNVVSVPGDFTFRLLGTYVSKFITDPGIQGGFITNSAGEDSGDIPHLGIRRSKGRVQLAQQLLSWAGGLLAAVLGRRGRRARRRSRCRGRRPVAGRGLAVRAALPRGRRVPPGSAGQRPGLDGDEPAAPAVRAGRSVSGRGVPGTARRGRDSRPALCRGPQPASDVRPAKLRRLSSGG